MSATTSRRNRKQAGETKALTVQCPRCKAAAGRPCINASGRALDVLHHLRVKAGGR